MSGVRRRATYALAVAVGAGIGIALAVAAGEPGATRQPPGERVRAWPASPFQGSLMPDDVPVPRVALRDASGETVNLAALREPALITFASAACQESCPLQAQVLREALDILGTDVPAFVVAVDPRRDTARRARRFLLEQRVSGRMRFLVGPHAALKAAWKGFAVAPQTAREHHQTRIVAVDGEGRQRVGWFLDQATPEAVAHDLELLLAESTRTRGRG